MGVGGSVAGFAYREQRFKLSYGFYPDTIPGYSTRARIVFGRAILPRDYDVTVGVVCKRPGAGGSIAENPRLPQRGEQAGRVCDSSAYLYRKPGRLFAGTVYRSQPLSIERALRLSSASFTRRRAPADGVGCAPSSCSSPAACCWSRRR